MVLYVSFHDPTLTCGQRRLRAVCMRCRSLKMYKNLEMPSCATSITSIIFQNSWVRGYMDDLFVCPREKNHSAMHTSANSIVKNYSLRSSDSLDPAKASRNI